MYTITISIVKYSILALYWRIFQYTSIRIPIWTMTGIVTCWGIACVSSSQCVALFSGAMLTLILQILVIIFQCNPISVFWTRAPGIQCNIDLPAFFLAISILNILSDIVILVLPIPYVMSLSRSAGQKVAVCCVLLSGSWCDSLQI